MQDKGLAIKERETGLQSWDPFREMLRFPLMSPFSGLFEDFLAPMRPLFPAAAAWMPKIDIQETEKDYILTAPLPGVRREDLKVEVKDEILTISGERKMEKEEKGKAWLRRESSYGSFHRSFSLPPGMHPEDVLAAYKDGVLTVTLRKPPQAKSRGVDIKVQ